MMKHKVSFMRTHFKEGYEKYSIREVGQKVQVIRSTNKSNDAAATTSHLYLVGF